MIDYLSLGYITDTNAVIYGGLTKPEIRSAVFRLWLQPNDIRARSILAAYAAYKSSGAGGGTGGIRSPIKSVSSYEWEPALMSRVMTRIARGIHRYDRYKEPLLVFLARDVINAGKDLLDAKKRIGEKVERDAGASSGASAVKARGALNAWPLADIMFQDFLVGLGSGKPCGEWVDGPPRRASGVRGAKSVNPIGAQVIRMSRDEVLGAVKELEKYSGSVAAFLDSLDIVIPMKPERAAGDGYASGSLGGAGDVDAGIGEDDGNSGYGNVAPGANVRLPDLDVFMRWYNETRVGAWAGKHKKMYEFLYRVKYLPNKKIGWRELDKMYEEEFGEKVPVSAHSALYGGVIEDFFGWLAKYGEEVRRGSDI